MDELSRKLNEEIPGAASVSRSPIIDNVTEAVTGSAADLAVIIQRPRPGQYCASKQSKALAIVRQVPGAADTAIEQEADQAQLRIRIDRESVARFGINVRDVQDVIEMAIGGRAAGTMFEGERRFDITVRYVPEAPGKRDCDRQRSDPDARRRTRPAFAARGDQGGATARPSSRGARTSGRSRSGPISVAATREASLRRRKNVSRRR